MEIISAEFSLLLVLTVIVLGGFFAYLLYIFTKMNRLKRDVQDLRVLEKDL